MALTLSERMAVANRLAERMRGLHAELRNARTWTGGERVRVYTLRGEYLEVGEDGTVTRSRRNMTWGQLLPLTGEAA